jgi:hypothetical protein
MLRSARMTASSGRTAAFRDGREQQLWAVRVAPAKAADCEKFIFAVENQPSLCSIGDQST